MSLILEALRKSEADRHQESLPESLARQQALIYAAKKQAFFWPLLICVLLIVNLVILGYFVFKTHFASAEIDPEQQSVPADSTSFIAEMSADRTLVSEPSDERSSVAAFTEISLSDVRASLINKPGLSAGTSSGVAIPGSEGNDTFNGLNELSEQADTESAVFETELITPAQRQESSEILMGNIETSAGLTNLPSDELTNPVTRSSAVPHVNELDESFLKTLPKLIFNSHIYSKEATGRRIMINDNYLREGEGFSGIQVFEITEDGVVLDKQGRQFMVPVVKDWSPEN